MHQAIILGADTTQIVGTGSIVVVLVTAFGYAVSLLSKGTERIDKSAAAQIAAAEAERDRAREEKDEELARVRSECEARMTEARREIDYWRARALGPGPSEERR